MGASNRPTEGPDTHDLDHLETLDADAPESPAGGLEPGARVGDKYAIVRLLGHGGMGAVYLARDERLARDVAIKVGLVAGSGALARAEREAQALARLSHPNVVVIYEVGEHGGRLFVAMEYVKGGTARAWLAAKPRTWREIVALYCDAGAGLAAAHAAGIVHRDFKPDNVLVGDDGRPRVADFGLARAPGTSDSVDAESPVSGVAPLSDRLTRTGAAIGTPAYMAPEQLDLADIDERVDQFAFCIALWEALHGARPFAGKTREELREGMRVAPRATNAKVPRYVSDALRRGLARDPAARWPTMAALVARLRRDRPRLGLALAVGALAIGGVASVVALRSGHDAADACAAVAHRIDGVWSPFDAGMVRDRFVATGRKHAPNTFELVRQDLDRYTATWADTRKDVCLAASVRHEQSAESSELRVQCLDRLADELGALVRVFERDADATTVDQAVGAVTALRSTRDCADATELAKVPPPPPAIAARVAELRATDDAIDAAYKAGRYKQTLPLARATAQAAMALGYAPLTAEVMRHVALFESTLHDDAAAERDYQTTLTLAGAGHDDHALMVAWNGLVASAIAQNHIAVALERLSYARAALALAGNQPHWVAQLDQSESSALLIKGDLTAALAVADHEVAELARPEIAPVLRVTGFNQRGRILNELHRNAEALAGLRETERIWEAELGPDHPNIAGVLLNIANSEESLQDYDAAARDLDRSAALTEQLFGPNALNLGRVLNNRCEVRFALHRADAVADCDRALAIKIKASGPDSPEITSTLMTQAKIAAQRDDLATAAAIDLRVLAIHEKALGPTHPKLTTDLYDLAEVAIRDGRPRDARAYIERGQRIADAAHDEVAVATGAVAFADVLRELGDTAAARTAIRDALARADELQRSHPSPENALAVAHAHAIAGQIEHQAGDLHAAETELRRAIELMDPVAGPGKANLAAPLAELGRVLAASGNAHEAAVMLGRAVQIFTTTAASPIDGATAELDLAKALWADGDHPAALAAARDAKATFDHGLAATPRSPVVIRKRADAAAWLASHGGA